MKLLLEHTAKAAFMLTGGGSQSIQRQWSRVFFVQQVKNLLDLLMVQAMGGCLWQSFPVTNQRRPDLIESGAYEQFIGCRLFFEIFYDLIQIRQYLCLPRDFTIQPYSSQRWI